LTPGRLTDWTVWADQVIAFSLLLSLRLGRIDDQVELDIECPVGLGGSSIAGCTR
jgi:hypothetical protein